MSQLKVNALVSYSGNTVTLGTSGDTINVASGVTFNTSSNIVLPAGAVGTPSLTTSGDTNTGIFFPAADTIGFAEGGTEAMRIDSSGRVGIGFSTTAEITTKLTVSNPTGLPTSTAANAAAIFKGDSGLGNGGAIGFDYDSDSTYYPAGIGYNITSNSNYTNGALVFSTRSATTDTIASERMRIDSSGNVGIGETSVTSKLHIKSDGSDYACARMNNTQAGTGSSNTVIFQRNGTNIGFITATGTATGYVTSSDYRLKENVVYNLNGIERIKLLKPARFNFIVEPNKIVDGFIAHEVSDIVPEAIHGTKDQIDSEGKPVHQGIDQSKIVPLLTGALQEAIAKIEQLEARLTALENNNV